MADKYPEISEALQTFIQQQKIFFVGSAGAEGKVNVSPKGMDTLRILNPKQVIWMNHTGSGNETAAHVRENGRMTIMFCAFEGKPLILRLYGQAKAIHPADAEWQQYIDLFEDSVGLRQMYLLDLDLVMTSCGYGVPLFDYQGDREGLLRWEASKGEQGIRQYWEEKNSLSLDGQKTGILDGAVYKK